MTRHITELAQRLARDQAHVLLAQEAMKRCEAAVVKASKQLTAATEQANTLQSIIYYRRARTKGTATEADLDKLQDLERRYANLTGIEV